MTIYCYDSAMPGAPVLTAAAGTLRSLLKACLVDGFAAMGVFSLKVSGGVATATYTALPPFRAGSMADFAGALPAALNGRKKIISVSDKSVLFAAPGVPDGDATGTITSKVAAAGWSELFPGSEPNVLVLKPAMPESTGCLLRLSDTGSWADVEGYVSMTDASTGEGRFPTPNMTDRGVPLQWAKSAGGPDEPRAWYVISDGRFLIFYVEPNSSVIGGRGGVVMGFGDIASYKSPDDYGSMISGYVSGGMHDPGWGDLSQTPGGSNRSGTYMAKSHAGTGGPVRVQKLAALLTSGGMSGMSNWAGRYFPYPNGVDFSLRVCPVEIISEENVFRGRVPGVYHTPQTISGIMRTGEIVEAVNFLGGRRLLVLAPGMPGWPPDPGRAGCIFVDLTGPWR